jgi:hypothetical protein
MPGLAADLIFDFREFNRIFNLLIRRRRSFVCGSVWFEVMPNLSAGVPAHRWVTLVAFFVVLLADAALASTSTPSASNSWLYQAKRPLILAHRGSRYLNPGTCAHNSSSRVDWR